MIMKCADLINHVTESNLSLEGQRLVQPLTGYLLLSFDANFKMF